MRYYRRGRKRPTPGGKKDFSPAEKERLMDTVGKSHSVRRKSGVLGLRRQTYYARKKGHRPEQEDERIAKQLHEITKQFVAWGFWMTFHYLRIQGYTWNHKRVYRIWKQEALNLRRPPKRPKLKRIYQDLLAPEKINEGWAMAAAARTL